MGTKKKTVIIAAAAGAAVICAGLFGIYKYFVTPERVVALSLMNAYERLDLSLIHICPFRITFRAPDRDLL